MIINLLSGPRNVSTALMYSFAQRADTKVFDEPLYGYYLKITGAEHPGRQEIMDHMGTGGIESIMNIFKDEPEGIKVKFIKNMAHHFIDLPTSLLLPFKNIILIRNPVDMLPSLINQIPDPTIRDTGLKHQWNIFTKLEEMGQHPIVIDAQIMLKDPNSLLKKLCSQLGIPYYDSMLNWARGPKPEDGIWAKYWYHRVHDSSGFEPYEKKTGVFPSQLKPLLAECRPFYKNLLHFAIH